MNEEFNEVEKIMDLSNLYYWILGVCTASITWLVAWEFLKC